MADVLLPPWIPVAEAEWRLVDFTARSQTTTSGAQKRVHRGQRLGVQLRFQTLTGRDRDALAAFAAQLRGAFGTAILFDVANGQRGTFPSSELFTNSTFADGTTGWSNSGPSQLAFTVRDRVATLRPTGLTQPGIYQQPTFSQGVPYALRSMLVDGAQSAGLTMGRFLSDSGAASVSDYAIARGLGTLTFVSGTTGVGTAWPYVMAALTGYTPGQQSTFVPYTSLQRCALVDNGPNAMQYANDPTNAAWSKGALTAALLGDVAPDGTTTAARITEDTSTGLHYIVQTRTRATGAVDVCTFGFFKRQVGTRDVRLWATNTAGVDNITAYFDLGAGTAGSLVVGGAATNGRSFIVPAGNGWYFCAVVGRMPSSTSISCEADLVSGGTPSYTGTTGALSTWRLGAAVTSVPTIGAATTTAGTAGSSSAGVSGVNLKGLPLSTTGLVVAGQRVEIAGETKIATADLNSDAAGLGYLQFEPVMRAAPADNAPVIIGQPAGRFVLTEDASWVTRPGMQSDGTLTFIEAA